MSLFANKVTKAEIAHRENPLEDKEVVRLLLEAGGDVNIQTHKVNNIILTSKWYYNV